MINRIGHDWRLMPDAVNDFLIIVSCFYYIWVIDFLIVVSCFYYIWEKLM